MISSFPNDDDSDDDNDDDTQPPSPIHQVCVGCGTPRLAGAFCDSTSIEKRTLPNVTCMRSAKEPDCPSTRGVALIGHLLPVSVVVDEFRVVGAGMKIGDVKQKVAQWKSPSNDMRRG